LTTWRSSTPRQPNNMTMGCQGPAQCPAEPHACCGVVSNGCCDASSPSGSASEASAPSPPKPAIACTSCEVEPGELFAPPMAPAGGSAAKPPSCHSNPT